MSKQKQIQYLSKQAQPIDIGIGPPRYQPPPQPPAVNQGILKPLNTKDSKSGKSPTDLNGVKQQPFPQQPFTSAVPNLKLYPLSTHQQFPYVGVQPPPSQQRNVQRHTDENICKVPQPNTQEPVARISVLQHGIKVTDEDAVRFISQSQNKTRISDDELMRLSPIEMLKLLKKTEAESGRYAAEQNKHIQALMSELRVLTEANQRLSDDNQELRDLCCFLDDDRQKGRKLAREWQRFGRYTASVMRQEVSAYQNKLRELDNKQQELIKDNLELKELCLYLDEERSGNGLCPSCNVNTGGGLRDDGDGSSSSTNADEPAMPTQFSDNSANIPRRSASRERILHENLSRQRSTFNDQTMQYVKNLETRIKQLEEERKLLQNKLSQCSNSGDGSEFSPMLSGRPEAVVRALQVLEVHDHMPGSNDPSQDGAHGTSLHNQLDDNSSADMDDSEKALVREMCNVVWRKLDDGSSDRI